MKSCFTFIYFNITDFKYIEKHKGNSNQILYMYFLQRKFNNRKRSSWFLDTVWKLSNWEGRNMDGCLCSWYWPETDSQIFLLQRVVYLRSAENCNLRYATMGDYMQIPAQKGRSLIL